VWIRLRIFFVYQGVRREHRGVCNRRATKIKGKSTSRLFVLCGILSAPAPLALAFICLCHKPCRSGFGQHPHSTSTLHCAPLGGSRWRGLGGKWLKGFPSLRQGLGGKTSGNTAWNFVQVTVLGRSRRGMRKIFVAVSSFETAGEYVVSARRRLKWQKFPGLRAIGYNFLLFTGMCYWQRIGSGKGPQWVQLKLYGKGSSPNILLFSTFLKKFQEITTIFNFLQISHIMNQGTIYQLILPYHELLSA